MVYQGGKSRQAKAIGRILLSVDRPHYLEPFVGGASVLVQVAHHFEKVTATDLHMDLIILYRALQDGWEPPETITEEQWGLLRTAEPSALRAFAGYACSFGGKWYGGYARNGKFNYAAIGARSLARKRAHLANVQFANCDYGAHQPGPNDVVYCDPPYLGRTPLTQLPPFDHQRFWNTMDSWVDAGAAVFVSEGQAPEPWQPVLHQREYSSLGLDNIKTYPSDLLFVRGTQ